MLYLNRNALLKVRKKKKYLPFFYIFLKKIEKESTEKLEVEGSEINFKIFYLSQSGHDCYLSQSGHD